MPTPTERTALKRALEAVWNGDAKMVCNMLYVNSTVNVNAVDPVGTGGMTLLMHAAFFNQVGVVSVLLRHPRINVWRKDAHGRTAFAQTFTHTKSDAFITMLKDPRVDLTDTIETGENALHVKCRLRRVSDVKALLKFRNLDINTKSSKGMYPLMSAIAGNVLGTNSGMERAAIVKVLLADPRISLEHIRGGLKIACLHSDILLADVILEYEATRVKADRVRLKILQRQSTAGLRLPSDVVHTYLWPFLGQTVVTQDVLDVTEGPGPEGYLTGLLTEFLLAYGNVSEFHSPGDTSKDLVQVYDISKILK